jgi:hypothetical protein
MADFESRNVVRPSKEAAEELSARLARKPDMQRLKTSREQFHADTRRADETGPPPASLPPAPVPSTPAGEREDTEQFREKMRGRLAITLALAFIVVIGLTFWYLLIPTPGSGQASVLLLMPLVALIGAVIGFYFGGQTATQAAAEAARQAATSAAIQTAAETVAQTARQVAAEAVTEAAKQERPKGR